MTILFGNAGTGAFTLGPSTHTFDAGTDDRTAAETLRDDYATANASWLDEYDADSSLNIILQYYNSTDSQYEVVYQIRSNSTWYDNSSSIAIKGDAGGVDEFSELVDTPSDYTGSAGYNVVVNDAEDGLEFTDQKAYIAVLSNTTQSISNDDTAPTYITDLELDTITSDDVYGWSVNATYGAIENTSDREYVLNTGVTSLHIVSSNASSATLYIFSETSSDGGTTWVRNANSGRQEAVAGNDENYSSKSSQFFNVPSGGLIRFGYYASDTSLSFTQVEFTVDTDTVTGPAFRLWLREM